MKFITGEENRNKTNHLIAVMMIEIWEKIKYTLKVI